MIIHKVSGDVAIKWILNRPPQIFKIDGTDRYYVFTPKQNVWMSWVKPEDVPRLLAAKIKHCNCNNGVYKNAFMYANHLDCCLWTYGNRCDGNNFDWEEI